MAKISLWSSVKGMDYAFSDKVAKEIVNTSGPAILIHKYLSAGDGTDETKIQDVLFLENRDRNYDTDVRELRAIFRPNDTNFNLSQFGIYLSSDVVSFEFHLNEMSDKLGRKLMSGDVLELPLERDQTLDGKYVNSYYTVQDALFSAPGHGATWFPHVWKVRAKKMTGAPEFQDIIDRAVSGDSIGNEGMGTGVMPFDWADQADDSPLPGEDCSSVSSYCKYLGITDSVVDEAASNVFYDPKFFETSHLYIAIDDKGYPGLLPWQSGTGNPPNGQLLRGVGVSFPADMEDGEYFLRVDYTPDRLFQKQGDCYKRICDDIRRIWTATNTRLDTYINNVEITTLDDGRQMTEKQAISKAGKSRVDLNQSNKAELTATETKRQRIAKKLSTSICLNGSGADLSLINQYAPWIKPDRPIDPNAPIPGGDCNKNKIILDINNIQISSIDSPAHDPEIAFWYQFNIITEDGQYVSTETGQLVVTEGDYVVYVEGNQIKISINDSVFDSFGLVDKQSIIIDIVSKATYTTGT